MLPFLLPLMGGISGLLGGGAAAGIGAATAAATGATAGGIGGLLGGMGGWALPLGLMGATALDRMMTPGMEDEEEEKRRKYRFSQTYDPTTGAFSGGYTDLGLVSGPIGGDVRMYKNGGLVKGYAQGGMIGEGDGFDPMQAGIASLTQGGGRSAMRQVDKQIVQQTIMALTGQIPKEQPLSMFIQRFGKPALADLAKRIVEQEAQSESAGMMVSGPGDGVGDKIEATAGQMPARLSDGEVVIPADAVSSLGNGSSRAGAEELMNMVRRIRREKNGSSQQPAAIEPAQYMPS